MKRTTPCQGVPTHQRQVCAFHLRNREAKWQLQVTWSGRPTALVLCEHPVYLGVTLDRNPRLSFKTHTDQEQGAQEITY